MYRLQNFPTDMGAPRDMPKGSGALSAQEYGVLKAWIDNMSSPNSSNPFTCNESEDPDTLNARRLTRLELRNTYYIAVARGIDYNWQNGQPIPSDTGTPPRVSAWMDNNYLNIYKNLPPDSSSTYSTADSNFSALHAQAYFNVTDQLIQFITNNPSTFANFVGNYIKYNPGGCTFSGDPANLSPACQTAFVKNLALRSWGREIESDDTNGNNELASIMQEFSLNSGAAAVNNVIFRIFMAPQMYFHINSSVTAVGPYYKLSSYSIARRLSYIFTQGPPDENLLQIAGTQDLSTDAGFNAAVSYLSQNMDMGINQFAYEWLKLDNLPQYKETSLPKFQYIATGLTLDENYRQAMKDDITELVTYITASNQGLNELFTSNVSFARNPTLMKVYNVSSAAPAKGTITEANAVRFPAGERSGLLTRAAMLFAGGQTENPMHRGVSIRKNLFCKTINPPPPDLKGALVAPPADPNMTTRDRYAAATSSSTCMGCHSMINPVGFSFSKYNSFGAYQANEPIFDPQGNFVKTLPTNAQGTLGVALGIDKDITDALDFSVAIEDATDVKACLSQNFYTYVEGLSSLPGNQPSCSMNRMYQALDGHASLKDFFTAGVMTPQFRYRKIVK